MSGRLHHGAGALCAAAVGGRATVEEPATTKLRRSGSGASCASSGCQMAPPHGRFSSGGGRASSGGGALSPLNCKQLAYAPPLVAAAPAAPPALPSPPPSCSGGGAWLVAHPLDLDSPGSRSAGNSVTAVIVPTQQHAAPADGAGACRPASPAGGCPDFLAFASPSGPRVHWRQKRTRGAPQRPGGVVPGLNGLNDGVWNALRTDTGRVTNMAALLRAVRDGGVSPHLRPAVWPLLLGLIAPGDSEAARADKWAAARGEFERLAALSADDGAAAAYYERRGAQEPWRATTRRISADATRTASDGPLFRGAARDGAVGRLELLLRAYALHDPGTGYCQGMADLAAPFVHLYASNAEAFAVYRCLMRPLAQNFAEGLAAIAGQLRELRALLAALEAPLLRHIEGLGAGGFETAFQMLLLMFRRELSWGDTFTFWEALWAGEALARAPLRVHAVAALFSARRRELLRLESLDELVVWVNGIGSDPDHPLNPLTLAADAHQMWAFLASARAGEGCGCVPTRAAGGGGAAAAAAAAAASISSGAAVAFGLAA
ncbi:hypothetical protein Rsub_03172 [Raphidocelis subcapitata]|uniref:Rab-GAP TBC domain-containing protein n=1 Tax=Raphidocelis subcapitata TaxID=307507 RepID=A0A2V0NYD9_9CHLO|nr:hypothetical protein Rsub_03172 [Raphidocelis subcapitata]|eukprot:GBF90600.1 hypothetical protein Rsub_03172 [Raphidocelis subcapitata]